MYMYTDTIPSEDTYQGKCRFPVLILAWAQNPFYKEETTTSIGRIKPELYKQKSVDSEDNSGKKMSKPVEV